MKKILLVGGCSFTDSNFKTYVHPDIDPTLWPKWPEIIAKKLDMQLVNVAFSGAGNEQIYSSLLDYISLNGSENIGLVLAAWSQCQRRDFQKNSIFAQVRDYWHNDRVDTKGDVFYWVRKSLRYFISFQNLCEQHKLPYKQFQMISLFESWLNGLNKRDTEIADYLRDIEGFKNFIPKYVYPGDPIKDKKKLIKLLLKYESSINTNNFLGWPTVKDLAGFYIEEKTMKDKDNISIPELVISEIDGHPTRKGHEVIAEFIYGQLA